MCGIAAIIPITSTPRLTREITDIIRHRGPDDEGHVFFNDGEVIQCDMFDHTNITSNSNLWNDQIEEESLTQYQLYLGHRRLSIIDLSPSGHQPMSYKNGRYWIVYNGEIYNYVEIKEKLIELGEIFNSQSDTEVILASYYKWGKTCLNKFNGMWAFLIYDKENNTLFGARDRFGVKPFYYWFSPCGFLAIGSEIKQFFSLPGWKAEMNEPRVHDYLKLGIVCHTQETLFKSVYQLNGGDFFEQSLDELKNGKIITQKWYKILPSLSCKKKDDNIEKFKNTFLDAVKIRLRADVSVGSCLSGGIDSSSIVCAVNKILIESGVSNHQYAFSACSTIPKYNECNYSQIVAEEKNVLVQYLYPSSDELVQSLDRMIWHLEDWPGELSILSMWSVYEKANQCSVKVLLDGQGADEYLGGYHPFYFISFYADLMVAGRFHDLISEIKYAYLYYGYSRLLLLLSALVYLLKRNTFLHKLIIFIRKKKNDHFILQTTEYLDKMSIDPYFQAAQYFKKESYLSLRYLSLPQLLHRVDRCSMANSVESRVPFTDYRLIEQCFGLSDDLIIHHGVTKKVLRESMKNILPDRIRKRMDKKGFITPQEHWIKKEKTDIFKGYLLNLSKFDTIFDTQKILHDFNNYVDGKGGDVHYYSRLICFSRWLEIFGISP